MSYTLLDNVVLEFREGGSLKIFPTATLTLDGGLKFSGSFLDVEGTLINNGRGIELEENDGVESTITLREGAIYSGSGTREFFEYFGKGYW